MQARPRQMERPGADHPEHRARRDHAARRHRGDHRLVGRAHAAVPHGDHPASGHRPREQHDPRARRPHRLPDLRREVHAAMARQPCRRGRFEPTQHLGSRVQRPHPPPTGRRGLGRRRRRGRRTGGGQHGGEQQQTQHGGPAPRIRCVHVLEARRPEHPRPAIATGLWTNRSALSVDNFSVDKQSTIQRSRISTEKTVCEQTRNQKGVSEGESLGRARFPYTSGSGPAFRVDFARPPSSRRRPAWRDATERDSMGTPLGPGSARTSAWCRGRQA